MTAGIIIIGFGAFALNAWALTCIRRQLDAINNRLARMATKEDEIMATVEEAKAAGAAALIEVQALRSQAEEIAQALRDLSAAGGATPAQLDELVAQFTAITGEAQAGEASTKDVDPTP